MYKKVVILSLMVAATTSFPTNGVADHLGTTRLPVSNDFVNKGEVVPTVHHSLVTLSADSGNPNELIEEADDSTAKTRKTRLCILTIAGDCSENGVDVEELLEHVEQMQQATFDDMDRFYTMMSLMMMRLLQASSEE